MHRAPLAVLLLTAASFGVHAQQKPADATDASNATVAAATTPAKPRPRNAVSQAIADLMRAAREQHDAQAARPAAALPAPPADTRAKAPDAPVLADSGGNGR